MTKTFYTDGACSINPGPGGFGVVELKEIQARVKDQWDNWNIYGYFTAIGYKYSEQCNNTTNNREELKAILHIFEIAEQDMDNQYIIYSDSSYAVNIINSWIYTWARNNWINSKNKEVENLDLIKNLYKYVSINFFNCQVKKCPGHSNITGNELADALATNNKIKFNKIVRDNHLILLDDMI